jgi:hypothetical protein
MSSRIALNLNRAAIISVPMINADQLFSTIFLSPRLAVPAPFAVTVGTSHGTQGPSSCRIPEGQWNTETGIVLEQGTGRGRPSRLHRRGTGDSWPRQGGVAYSLLLPRTLDNGPHILPTKFLNPSLSQRDPT